MIKTVICLTIFLFIELSWQQENGFLLATYSDRINRIDPLNGRVEMLFNTEEYANRSIIKSINAVDFDTKYNCLFYEFRFKIFKKCLDGNRTEHVIVDFVYGVRSISYDLTSELLYICSNSKLETVKIVHDEIQPINHMRRTLNNIGHNEVVVDPVNKYIFWITRNPYYIWRSNLDGSETKIIVDNSSLQKPEAIAFDQTRNLIYWTDLDENTIGHCDLNGDSVVIRKLRFWPFHEKISFMKIAVAESRVFVYGYYSRMIFFVNKDNDEGDFFCDRRNVISMKFISTIKELSANYSAAEYCDCSYICGHAHRYDKSFACQFEDNLNQTTTGYCVCNNSGRSDKPSTDGYCTRNVSVRHVSSGILWLTALLASLATLKC